MRSESGSDSDDIFNLKQRARKFVEECSTDGTDSENDEGANCHSLLHISLERGIKRPRNDDVDKTCMKNGKDVDLTSGEVEQDNSFDIDDNNAQEVEFNPSGLLERLRKVKKLSDPNVTLLTTNLDADFSLTSTFENVVESNKVDEKRYLFVNCVYRKQKRTLKASIAMKVADVYREACSLYQNRNSLVNPDVAIFKIDGKICDPHHTMRQAGFEKGQKCLLEIDSISAGEIDLKDDSSTIGSENIHPSLNLSLRVNGKTTIRAIANIDSSFGELALALLKKYVSPQTPDEIHFMFDGLVLNHASSLRNQNIEAEDLIDVRVPEYLISAIEVGDIITAESTPIQHVPVPHVKISLRFSKDVTISACLPLATKIGRIAMSISKQFGIPNFNNIKFKFDGFNLEHSSTISDHNIEEDDQIDIIIDSNSLCMGQSVKNGDKLVLTQSNFHHDNAREIPMNQYAIASQNLTNRSSYTSNATVYLPTIPPRRNSRRTRKRPKEVIVIESSDSDNADDEIELTICMATGVINPDDVPIFTILVKRDDKFSALVGRILERFTCQNSAIILYYQDHPLNMDATPRSRGIKNGDLIQANLNGPIMLNLEILHGKSTYPIQILSNEKLMKIKTIFESQVRMAMNKHVEFRYFGSLLNLNDTPVTVGIKDGGTIRAVIKTQKL